jgi:hypothetical protein
MENQIASQMRFAITENGGAKSWPQQTSGGLTPCCDAARVYTKAHRAASTGGSQSQPKPAQEVLLALLEKCSATGVDEISDPRIFRLPPFIEMGQALGGSRRFGSLPNLQSNLTELQRRNYD